MWNNGRFFNELKKLTKEDTEIMDLPQLHHHICNIELSPNLDYGKELHQIVRSLKYHIFEREHITSQSTWEQKVAIALLQGCKLESHLNTYLGLDVTDDEMADSVFATKQLAK